MALHPPFLRTAYNSETVLKCIETYLSRDNFEDNFNTWLRNPVIPENPQAKPGAVMDRERDVLIDITPEGVLYD